jgi:hypothetical protein
MQNMGPAYARDPGLEPGGPALRTAAPRALLDTDFNSWLENVIYNSGAFVNEAVVRI